MPAIVTNHATETCLRRLLIDEGFSLNLPRAHGETGTDIIASRDGVEIHVEVIGFKSSPPARSKDFYESFFRAVSRLENGAVRCVIALPHRFGVGLPSRARQYGIAWSRIGDAFPELEIWLVNTEDGEYEVSEWNAWVQ